MTKPFKEFVEEMRAWYKRVGKVYCPLLNDYVFFNSKGFYHLRYTSNGRARKNKEQMYKIGLLPLVIPAIKSAKTIYEYKKEKYSGDVDKTYEIWELRCHVGKSDVLLSVVLRRMGNGNITFLSVWKHRKKRK